MEEMNLNEMEQPIKSRGRKPETEEQKRANEERKEKDLKENISLITQILTKGKKKEKEEILNILKKYKDREQMKKDRKEIKQMETDTEKKRKEFKEKYGVEYTD